MDYIPIRAPFSLNKDSKTVSDKPSGECIALENYIPSNNILKTREGISEFNFSGGYNPADDPDCLMWLKFEGGQSGYRDCEIQGDQYMQVSAVSSVSPSTTQKVVGASSLFLDYGMPGGGLGLYYYRKNNALPANFPGQGGTGDCIITWWSRFKELNIGTAVLKHDDESLQGGFSVKAVDVGGGAWRWRLRMVDSENTTRTVTDTTSPISINKWYHIGIWSSETVGNGGMVIYDANTTLEVTVKFSPTGTLGGTAANGTYQLWVGMDRNNSKTFTDDFILLNATPDTEAEILAKIRNMRNRGL